MALNHTAYTESAVPLHIQEKALDINRMYKAKEGLTEAREYLLDGNRLGHGIRDEVLREQREMHVEHQKYVRGPDYEPQDHVVRHGIVEDNVGNYNWHTEGGFENGKTHIKLNIGGHARDYDFANQEKLKNLIAKGRNDEAVSQYRNSPEYKQIMEDFDTLLDTINPNLTQQIDVAGHSVGGWKARVLTPDIHQALTERGITDVDVKGYGLNAFLQSPDDLPPLRPKPIQTFNDDLGLEGVEMPNVGERTPLLAERAPAAPESSLGFSRASVEPASIPLAAGAEMSNRSRGRTAATNGERRPFLPENDEAKIGDVRDYRRQLTPEEMLMTTDELRAARARRTLNEGVEMTDINPRAGPRTGAQETAEGRATFEYHTIARDPADFKTLPFRKTEIGNGAEFKMYPEKGVGFKGKGLVNQLMHDHYIDALHDVDVDRMGRPLQQPNAKAPLNRNEVVRANPETGNLETYKPSLWESVKDLPNALRNMTAKEAAVGGAELGIGFAAGVGGAKIVDAFDKKFDPGRSTKTDVGSKTLNIAENTGAASVLTAVGTGALKGGLAAVSGGGLGALAKTGIAAASEAFLPTAAAVGAGMAASELSKYGTNEMLQAMDVSEPVSESISNVVGSTVGGGVGAAAGIGASMLLGAEVGAGAGPAGIALGAGLGLAIGGGIEIADHAADIIGFTSHLFGGDDAEERKRKKNKKTQRLYDQHYGEDQQQWADLGFADDRALALQGPSVMPSWWSSSSPLPRLHDSLRSTSTSVIQGTEGWRPGNAGPAYRIGSGAASGNIVGSDPFGSGTAGRAPVRGVTIRVGGSGRGTSGPGPQLNRGAVSGNQRGLPGQLA